MRHAGKGGRADGRRGRGDAGRARHHGSGARWGRARHRYLSARGGGPFPVILERTPYDKSAPSRSERTAAVAMPRSRAEVAAYFVAHGYAVAYQDCRGRYRSEGRFTKYLSEAEDGCDTLATGFVSTLPAATSRISTSTRIRVNPRAQASVRRSRPTASLSIAHILRSWYCRSSRWAVDAAPSHQRNGWRQTEYHSPRLSSFHFGSAQFFLRTSGEIVALAAAGLSSEHPPTSRTAATAKIAALTAPLPSLDPSPWRRRDAAPIAHDYQMWMHNTQVERALVAMHRGAAPSRPRQGAPFQFMPGGGIRVADGAHPYLAGTVPSRLGDKSENCRSPGLHPVWRPRYSLERDDRVSPEADGADRA